MTPMPALPWHLPWITQLNPAEEVEFRQWVKSNRIPFNPDQFAPDYDMRGFWKAMKNGDPNAIRSHLNGHFPDTWKTPAHKTFSNESIYAGPTAPHWVGDRLINPQGKVVADETPAAKKGTTP